VTYEEIRTAEMDISLDANTAGSNGLEQRDAAPVVVVGMYRDRNRVVEE
jgi:hypothetical protein